MEIKHRQLTSQFARKDKTENTINPFMVSMDEQWNTI